jgi:predicted TIM-barrel fold metal-dependent hydrolase
MNIRTAIEKVGADRILFGSDFPESDLSLELEKMSLVEMTDEARARIMGENAATLWR